MLMVEDTEVIKFLLETEIIPLCLQTMESGSELSKTVSFLYFQMLLMIDFGNATAIRLICFCFFFNVATFIIQKILLDNEGLRYMCVCVDRFFALSRVLGNMVTSLAEAPSPRLLKHIVEDTEVIKFLLETEIIPLCLQTMESGSELSKTVATFIIQKILLDNEGLRYMCVCVDRFFALSRVLGNMVTSLAEAPSPRLLKHIVEDAEVIMFLLETEIIPLCLQTMESGSELSKTVATFIIQKILLDNKGLRYMCVCVDRFFALSRLLGNMIDV
ncbi:LOW QUALITY PROTEIN: hypothetical protein HID58_018108 [Brassica napus]|uniref:Serine/threonine-protein phosphatase 4 regulatory subunit 3-like central domain-containing protein n=1 Tax=Brassica napus TaxID=3708 RepID=A0ABQ8DA57_BRANA|nr:LOW QUALITY PROTEIN: hypothetical protein HID58_018108 [Brassica napus]